MGVRGGASMRMGAAPPSSAPKSLLAASGESESESDLPRFDGPCGVIHFMIDYVVRLGVTIGNLIYFSATQVQNTAVLSKVLSG
jgi:hypothetical protein